MDCTGITFADLTLLHTLITAAASPDLILAGPLPHSPTALLDGTQTNDLFTVAATLDDALRP
ncbi:hypothetical protein [Streptomyces sp. NRRL S-87]|uniref:hypothetical protein n=1 Tax=Streptomyces sp. NRRL S-87 TaxID=1463920 RepID=UPI0004BEA622|nr:hypothetical protein [Streptomyces sp. NRRL S-87]